MKKSETPLGVSLLCSECALLYSFPSSNKLPMMMNSAPAP